MLGLMQEWPLLVSKILEHAEINHNRREIVTLTTEGPEHRYTYGECGIRARKVAQALERLGVGFGDRIGTLAWNTYRHVECWYAISGMGAVTHTINPRLFPEQIVYIANHAEDRILFFDTTFMPLIEKLGPMMKSIEHFVAMTDSAHMPETSLPNVVCYEDIVEAEDGNYEWPEFDENTAAGLCYTSGTTGNPKGVLYSNRSNVLVSMSACTTDALSMSSRDNVLPVVPMF
ncbi:MAG: AMP-binding protein, partial [Pseudomonadota bacterium]